MAAPPSIDPLAPLSICGHSIRSILTPGTSFLGDGEGARLLVLKLVDPDCMLGKGLHPSIVDRLGRVREVAHAGVANLIGVEKGPDGDAWMVWEYVEGETLLEWSASEHRTSRELLVMARELMLNVDQLHMQGLVHGAIISGNVIVGSDGTLKLTHLSPLLYTDIQVDVESVVGLLTDVGNIAGKKGESLRKVVEERTAQGAKGGEGELRRLAAHVAGVLGGATAKQDDETQAHGDTGRRIGWMLVQVLGVVIGGLLLAYGVWRAFEK